MGDFIALCNNLKAAYNEVSQSLLPSNKQEQKASCFARGALDWRLGKFCSPKGL